MHMCLMLYILAPPKSSLSLSFLSYIYICVCMCVYICIYVENLPIYLNNKSLNCFIYIFQYMYICIKPLTYTGHREVEGCLMVPHTRRLGSSRDLPIVSCRHAEAGLSMTQLPWSHHCSNNSISSHDLIGSPI